MNKVQFIILLTILLLAVPVFAEEVKQADLAGKWYPRSGTELKAMLEGYLKAADPEEIKGEVFAIIAPHAGYQFSGPVAAYAYKVVENKNIKTVILIGFSHRKFYDGISVYDRGSFSTPLGEIKVDTALASGLISQNKRIAFNPQVFKDENSIEMEIPFIQLALKGAKVVPVIFGTQTFGDAEILADALSKILKGRKDYLIIASTDMSHYHSYDEARSIDDHAIRLLKGLNANVLYEDAKLGLSELCGILPVSATLLAAEKMGYKDIVILKYANSGDTYGDKENVVGYVAAVIYKESLQPSAVSFQQKKEGEDRMLNENQRKKLLRIARESITSYVRDNKRERFTETDAVLNEPMGAFVTLHEGGELRGCIGNMVGAGPLYQTVASMAVEAATGDPRFSPLSPSEIDKVDVEISVLSPLKKVSNPDEIKIPGHGVIVRRGFRSGVYLPQVADETGWTKEEFLTSLCAHKAGLAPDAWKDPKTEIYIFTAEVFGEKGGTR